MRGGLLRAYQDSHRKGESNQATAGRLTSRSMHHQTTISLALAGAIIADLEVTADRIDASLYAVEGWHPDLRRVVVIESSTEAVLVSEVPLPDL
jgi:hypothetical protein